MSIQAALTFSIAKAMAKAVHILTAYKKILFFIIKLLSNTCPKLYFNIAQNDFQMIKIAKLTSFLVYPAIY